MSNAEHPFFSLEADIPFAALSSPDAAEPMKAAVVALLERARAGLDALVGKESYARWEDGAGALDTLTESLDHAVSVMGHLEAVATTPALRTAFAELQAPISSFYSALTLSPGLYRALRGYRDSEEGRALEGPRRRYLHKTLEDLRRNGAELDDAGKAKLEALDVELAELTLKYSQNVLDATQAFELVLDDRAALAGLPESAIAAAAESAASKGQGGYRFTLAAPSYLAVLTHADDATLREKLYRAANTRATAAPFDNRPLVRRILELRRARASLLGFPHFADLVLADRMAQRGQAARAFIANLRAQTKPFFHRENEELLAFRREIEGPDAAPLRAWDVAYYAEKLRKARFDFDDEALRPYFALPNVLAGLFEIAHRLYGVRVLAWPEAETWHADVRGHRIVDESGHTLARFYVDVGPRETKRDGAWMQGILTGHRRDGVAPTHLEVLVANVTPGVGGKPPLLTHREVETLFHEFGHLMHHACSDVPVRSLAGTNVAWDFVELPSQIMENWCWEKSALDLFAKHVDTGAPLPEELLGRMQRARTFRQANAMMRQLGFAELDLALHMDFDPNGELDVVSFGRAILERHNPVDLPSEHAMVCSFTHLFGSAVGYAAGYYSYKWAEVLDADAFSRFADEGIFSRAVGDDFRRIILASGDAEDPAELFRRFRGRDPSVEPLMRRAGLSG
jgi:oligopeptidase A